MSDQSSLPLRPILPRNMTARAKYPVPGNPMTARPESGVGNAHPGLEFDVRALDRHFLPGLVFDFQYGIGARLVDINKNKIDPGEVTAADIGQGLYLWAVRGRFGIDPDRDTTANLAGVDGYKVLRKIMDLEPGRLTVVVGPPPGSDLQAAIGEAVERLSAGETWPTGQREGRSYVCFEGDRAKFLTDDGVIDPGLMPPGEITRNLCSPWQWDFADCYCYYWASSKPDIVIGLSGEAQVLNFQRDRNARERARPAAGYKQWQDGNITEAAMITGWEDLPIVTYDREGVVPRIPHWPLIDQPMTMAEIASELTQLAELEHALCVEYLFAHFSMQDAEQAPMAMAIRRGAARRYQAANGVMEIAQDEMRHFRWVNEALALLEKVPHLKRAGTIGRDLRRFFELRPLTPNALDEFIGIEAPSSVFNDDPQQLDGVYTRILVSLHNLTPTNEDEAHAKPRLMQLMKVIIDEGESHWQRFRLIKEHLAGQASTSYLRYLKAPGEATKEPERTLQKLGDAYYDLLLVALYITFRQGRDSRGDWLKISHQAMYALADTAYRLADRKSAALFTLPNWCKKEMTVPDLLAPRSPPPDRAAQHANNLAQIIGSEETIEAIFKPVDDLLKKLKADGPKAIRLMAEKQLKTMDTMKEAVDLKYEGRPLRPRMFARE